MIIQTTTQLLSRSGAHHSARLTGQKAPGASTCLHKHSHCSSGVTDALLCWALRCKLQICLCNKSFVAVVVFVLFLTKLSHFPSPKDFFQKLYRGTR